MTVTSQTIVLTLIAALMAVPAFFMFNKMPEAWLQDYDFDPKAENVRWAKRLKPYHIGIFAVIYAIVVFLSSAIYPEFLCSTHYLRVIGLFTALPGFPYSISSVILPMAISGSAMEKPGITLFSTEFSLQSSEAVPFFSSLFFPLRSQKQRRWAWETSSYCSSVVFFPVSKDCSSSYSSLSLLPVS